MAKVTSDRASIQINTKIILELDEAEARALDGIFGYNVESFLKVFYERMGRAYVEPYEAGVRSLHKTIRSELQGPLRRVSEMRAAVLDGLKKDRDA
jgi:hypothetical protein